MTAPKLATTRPAALTGRVGQGGDTRVHDVALVQALLGAKRAKGQSLAVLVSTATPYSYKTMAEPGPIRGLKAKELSAERKVELMQVMKEFTRDWGIAFDVEVTVAPFDPGARSIASARAESRPLVARFTPRNFFAHNGRRLSSVMTKSTRFAPGRDHARKRGIRGKENNDSQNKNANAIAMRCGQGNSKDITKESTTPVRNHGIGIRAKAKTTWRMRSGRRSSAIKRRKRSVIIRISRPKHRVRALV